MTRQRRRAVLAALTTLLTLLVTPPAGAADYPNPGVVTGDVAVHDPSVVKVNGTYYLLSTGTGLEIRTSTDEVKDELLTDMLIHSYPQRTSQDN